MSILKPDRSTKVGVAVAALAMLALMMVVSIAVMRWCPRGEDCKQASQVLFGLGMVVSFGASVAAGFIARDIADRFASQSRR